VAPTNLLNRCGRNRVAVFAAVLVLPAGCGKNVPAIGGVWIGDARLPGSVERFEVAVDSTGASAKFTLPGWGLDGVDLARAPTASDSIEFSAVLEHDAVRLRGTLDGEHWLGEVTRGDAAAPFDARQIYDLSDSEWGALVGTYGSAGGRLLGIGRFSEFGSRPVIVDYTTGRIGPLYPVSRKRLLVGHSLVAPVFPADSLELRITPGGEVEGIRFDQRGQPPVEASRLWTRDEEVRFAAGSVTLSGTLTLPASQPPYPALVLVHGSNALTRDVFGPWTRFFAGLGVAVLSFDKRGTGGSTGDWKQADFHALAADVTAAVRFLAARSEIRADAVGLWGASQGGWIMPIVATEAPGEIAFMIVHAGSGTTVREQGVLYLRNELRAAGLPEESIAVGIRYQLLDDQVTASDSGWSELLHFYEEHRTGESWLWPPQPADDWFRTYYRMLMDFDPAPMWQRVTCPVLFLFGELDANVPPTESWPPIERALLVARNDRASHAVLPKANHLFLEATTGGRDEYPRLSHFAPDYFATMAEWLADQVR